MARLAAAAQLAGIEAAVVEVIGHRAGLLEAGQTNKLLVRATSCKKTHTVALILLHGLYDYIHFSTGAASKQLSSDANANNNMTQQHAVTTCAP